MIGYKTFVNHAVIVAKVKCCNLNENQNIFYVGLTVCRRNVFTRLNFMSGQNQPNPGTQFNMWLNHSNLSIAS